MWPWLSSGPRGKRCSAENSQSLLESRLGAEVAARWPQSQDTRVGTCLVLSLLQPWLCGQAQSPFPAFPATSAELCFKVLSRHSLERAHERSDQPASLQDGPSLGHAWKNTEVRQIEHNCFYFSLHQYTVDEVGSLWRVQSLLNLEIIYSCFYCFTLSTSNGSNSKTTAQIKCWCCSFPFYKCSIFVEGNDNRKNRLQPLPMMDCNKPMKLWECV